MKVSVIIPCFNVEQYVARAIESALKQSHADLELICVDDGSTDGTLQILKHHRDQYPERMGVIEQPNRGACAARNAGMDLAQGTYLQFLDADDVILPDKISHQVEIAQRSVYPDVIVGSSRTISPDGKVVRTVVQKLNDRDPWLDLMAHRMNIT